MTIYLDNAATTFPKPSCVADEMSKCIKNYCGNPGRSSHSLALKCAEKIYETRCLLANFFNASSENVIFTQNTTYALNIAIKSAMKYSTHILISDIEHNSVYRPVYRLAKEKLCTFDIFKTSGTDEEIMESIQSLIKPHTSMLICLHASNVCSKRLPIKKIGKICKENGIYFIVDGAQSAGVYNIDIEDMNIDALCIPAHKGLYGPQGVGAIIFKNEILGRTLFEGGTGINSLEPDMPDILPERYEAGTLQTPAIVGLNASLNWLKSISLQQIQRHEEDLYSLLLNELREMKEVIIYNDSNFLGNTLMFNFEKLESSYLSSELNRRGICTRSGFHCSPLAHKVLSTPAGGALRVSFGLFNTRRDVYALLDALNEITKNK